MRKLILLCGFVLCVDLAKSQNLTSSQKEKLDEIASRDVPSGAPGVAVGIVQDGNIIYEAYYGYADLSGDSTLIGPETRFNIASNAKQFVALAILKLAKEGELSLKDDFRQYLPDILPEYEDSIRIEHLITHTSGIRDVYDLLALQGKTWWQLSYSNQDVLDFLQQQQDVNFAPGSQYLYSNSNYILLAEIISVVSRKRVCTYMDDFFTDLGMKKTFFPERANEITAPWARPYFNFNTWTSFDWTWQAIGDGNLFSTLRDQLTYELWWHQSRPQLAGVDLSPVRQKLTVDNSGNYGFGLEFDSYIDELEYVYHNGSTGAWKASFVRVPEMKLSVVTLSNSGKTITEAQTREMLDLLLEVSHEKTTYSLSPPQSDEVFDEKEICGSYEFEKRTVVRFENRNTGIWLVREGRSDIELIRESGNVFQQKYDPTFKQEFTRDSDGEICVTFYHPTHAPYKLDKIPAAVLDQDIAGLPGTYYNQEIKSNIELYVDSLGLNVKTERFSVPAVAVTADQYVAAGYLIRIEQIDSTLVFYLDGDRIRNVQFKRINK